MSNIFACFNIVWLEIHDYSLVDNSESLHVYVNLGLSWKGSLKIYISGRRAVVCFAKQNEA